MSSVTIVAIFAILCVGSVFSQTYEILICRGVPNAYSAGTVFTIHTPHVSFEADSLSALQVSYGSFTKGTIPYHNYGLGLPTATCTFLARGMTAADPDLLTYNIFTASKTFFGNVYAGTQGWGVDSGDSIAKAMFNLGKPYNFNQIQPAYGFNVTLGFLGNWIVVDVFTNFVPN